MAKMSRRRITWMTVLVGLFLTGLCVYFFQSAKQQTPSKYTIDKKGSGAVVDFTDGTKKVHAAVDMALSKAGASTGLVKENLKEVPRKKMEGSIRWHVREVSAVMPAGVTIESLQEILRTALPAAGGQVFTSQPDTYQGAAVIRLDIGLKDQLEGEEVTIISDRIYLNSNNTRALENADKSGVLPNKGSAQGKMAIIIDDFGYNQQSIDAFTAMNRPLTFAVIPYRPFSNEAAAKGLSSGKQVILHLPMEPLAQSAQSEETTVSVAMSDEEIQDIVKKAVQSIPGLIGVNNHQGSRATADRRVMQDVLSVLKAKHLFFVDSRTNSQSIAAQTARQMGLQAGENDLFIDNTDDVVAVKAKLRTAGNMAIKHGAVTVIGHARMNTALAVRDMIPELEAQGIQLVFVSQLLH